MLIKVCGTAGEGKTGIASFIERYLHIRGVEAIIIDENEEQYLLAQDMNARMDAIAAREDYVLTIETVQIQDEPSES